MINSWIPIKEMTPPKVKGLRLLIYTPIQDECGRYRIVPSIDWGRFRDATHWQPCLPPEVKA